MSACCVARARPSRGTEPGGGWVGGGQEVLAEEDTQAHPGSTRHLGAGAGAPVRDCSSSITQVPRSLGPGGKQV